MITEIGYYYQTGIVAETYRDCGAIIPLSAQQISDLAKVFPIMFL